MKRCEAKYAVLKNFFESEGYCLNAFLISERTDIDLRTAYRCISSLVIAGYIRLSFVCASDHQQARAADFYEITPEGIDFISKEKKFCRTWKLSLPAGIHWQWRFPYFRLNRS